MKNDLFKSFMREFEEENELLHIHITIEFQTVQYDLYNHIELIVKNSINTFNQLGKKKFIS